jgi:hypothetical protein
MRDTSPQVEAQLRALYQAKSPGDRLRMATVMFGAAKRLSLAGLKHENANLEGTALRVALLQRLYGDDLSPEIIDLVAASGSDI